MVVHPARLSYSRYRAGFDWCSDAETTAEGKDPCRPGPPLPYLSVHSVGVRIPDPTEVSLVLPRSCLFGSEPYGANLASAHETRVQMYGVKQMYTCGLYIRHFHCPSQPASRQHVVKCWREPIFPTTP